METQNALVLNIWYRYNYKISPMKQHILRWIMLSLRQRYFFTHRVGLFWEWYEATSNARFPFATKKRSTKKAAMTTLMVWPKPQNTKEKQSCWNSTLWYRTHCFAECIERNSPVLFPEACVFMFANKLFT